MIRLEEIIWRKFKDKVGGIERYKHSLGVLKESKKLVNFHRFDLDYDKIYKSALLHDYAKFESYDTYKQIIQDEGLDYKVLLESSKLFHSLLGPYLIKKELNIFDEDVLNAVKYHTTGRANMSLLEEIIFLADFIEENRTGKIFEDIREIAYSDFKKAIALELELLIKNLTLKNQVINSNTIEAYYYYKKYL